MIKTLLSALATALMLSACAANSPEIEPAYGNDYERFADNVRIKMQDEYSITYEYKDVRIDEIAFMASEYCHEQGDKRAVLHDSQLFKNFSRRATFDCI